MSFSEKFRKVDFEHSIIEMIPIRENDGTIVYHAAKDYRSNPPQGSYIVKDSRKRGNNGLVERIST